VTTQFGFKRSLKLKLRPDFGLEPKSKLKLGFKLIKLSYSEQSAFKPNSD